MTIILTRANDGSWTLTSDAPLLLVESVSLADIFFVLSGLACTETEV